MHLRFFTALLLMALAGCSGSGSSGDSAPSSPSSTNNSQLPPDAPKAENESWDDYIQRVDNQPLKGQDLLAIDLNQSLEDKSLAELRLLRNALYAQQGHIFMGADLRGYFSKHSWYDSLMYERWEREASGANVPMEFTQEEQTFIARVKAREAELLTQNYLTVNSREIVNANNIANSFQFGEFDEGFTNKLSLNGFVITPNTNIQLFHLYEQNDYQQVPNFVTTDLFLQLYHMYFSFLLRSLEEDIFYKRMAEFSEAQYKEALRDYQSSTDEKVKKAAAFSVVVYHVATGILGSSNEGLPNELQAVVDVEMQNINSAQDNTSEFLGYTTVMFPYSLFKPRGHYTRSEQLQNYFKAMMWLQKAEMCLNTDDGFENAIYMAQLMKKTKVGQEPAQKVFESVYRPIKYIIGEPDNISVYDILEQERLIDKELAAVNKARLKEILLGLGRNRISPKGDQMRSCRDKVNLFPQRYLFDNEVLQDLVDTKTKPNTTRAFPKGIDVFGVLGVAEAKDLLFETYKEDEVWPEYRERFEELERKSKDQNQQTVYAKWVECLVQMQAPKSDDVPFFMEQAAWRKKELNTALASWAELKHDAILYAEQPIGAECGGGGPPDPITVGYVEPNLPFWKSVNSLIRSTNVVLAANDLMVDEIKNKSERIQELGEFLLNMTQKELNGEKLTESEYRTIEVIGSTVEYITISLLPHWVDDWSMVKGPDREVSVVADIYTASAENNPNKGILHVGVGPVNDIHVVVEIDGLLYLTKGATFSYYEFVEPMGSRLTDEQWQERIKQEKLPPIPDWMKDIIHDNAAPKPDEKIFYSSGC